MAALNTEFRDDVLSIQFTEIELREPDQIKRVGAELQQACRAVPAGKLLLDFRNVSFLTSEMVGQLFLLASYCESQGIELKGCNISDNIRNIFETVQLSAFLEPHVDEAAARAAFAAQKQRRHDSQEFDIHPDRLAQAAAEGDADAEFELSVRYEQGRGVERDMDEALRRLRRAAEENHPHAQYKLGMAYAYGIHVEQDFDEAIAWYRRAAEQGQSEAQYMMGISYQYGIAADEDRESAAAWFDKAAAQGHERAALEARRFERDVNL